MQPIQLPVVTCRMCGYQWTPRISLPRVCPGCGSQRWDRGPMVSRRKQFIEHMKKMQQEQEQAQGQEQNQEQEDIPTRVE